MAAVVGVIVLALAVVVIIFLALRRRQEDKTVKMKNIKWELLGCVILLACVTVLALPSLALAGSTNINGTMPLKVSNVQALNITVTTANISWETNGNSNSSVFYDTTSHSNIAGYPNSASNSALVSNHNVQLTGLSPDTTYYFMVESVAMIGSTPFTAISGEYTFKTLPPEAIIVPDNPAGGDSFAGFSETSPQVGFTVEYWDIGKSPLMQWGQGSDGALLENVEATSLDGMVTVHISAGTKVVDYDGNPISQILVNLLYPLSEESPSGPLPDPPDGYSLIAAFDFKPDGTQFIGSGIQITLTYDPESISEGDNPVIAFFNEGTGSWEFISGVPGPGDNEVTFTTDHFTIYAVFVESPESLSPVLPVVTPSSISSIWWIVLAAVLGIPLFWGANLLWIYSDRKKQE